MHCTLIIAVAVAALSPSAAGSLVVDNGTPNGTVAGPIEGFVLADDFTLGGQFLLTGAEFWSIESEVTPWNGVLHYYFLADVGGAPALSVIVQGFGQNIVRTATGNTGVANAVLPEYFWTFEFESPVSLTAHTPFWFGINIGEGLPTGPGVQGHFWESGDPGAGLPVRRGTYSSPESFLKWEELTPARDAAFRLVGQAIPEASCVLCWMGLIALVNVFGLFARTR